MFFPCSKNKFDRFNASFSCSIHPFYIYSYIISWSSFWGFSWCANCWRLLVFFQNHKEAIWIIDYTLGLKLVLINLSTCQFRGDDCLQLRWHLFFCMRTCDIFSLGEWFLTFFVHTDFYSFTASKNAEFDLNIYCKSWAIFF